MNMGQGGAGIGVPVQCCTECNKTLINNFSSSRDRKPCELILRMLSHSRVSFLVGINSGE